MKSRLTSSAQATRRRFLSQLAAASAVVSYARLAPEASAAEKKKKAAGGAPEPLAPWTGGPTVIHVFSKPLYWMSYADAAAMIKAAGYGGVDYTVRVPQGHVLPEKVQEDLPRAVEAATKAGL